MKKIICICLFVLGLCIFLKLLPVVYWQFLLTNGRSNLDVASDRAILKAGKKLREKYGLYSSCFGGSCTDEGVTSFALDLHRYGPAFDRDEARELILECLAIFHKIVNEDKNVRKFLSSYPFPLEGMHIGIYNLRQDRYFHFHPDILVVRYADKSINYLTESREDRNTSRFTSEYEEPYEEAVEIVRKQRMERQAAWGALSPLDQVNPKETVTEIQVNQ